LHKNIELKKTLRAAVNKQRIMVNEQRSKVNHRNSESKQIMLTLFSHPFTTNPIL